MKAIIVTNEYPSENDLYKNAFVHRRVKNYIANDIEIKVFVISKEVKEAYNFDGVEVIPGRVEIFEQLTEEFKPDKILVHFLHRRMADTLTKFNKKIPVIVWVHGIEALAWYRRLFNIKNRNFLRYIAANTLQMISLRKFIRNNPNIQWVFVSNWMKRIMERDTFTKVEKYSIIPNVVDTKIFYFTQKEYSMRNKILVIRPFDSKKYATDIIVKTLLELNKNDKLKEYEVTIIGDGPYFDKVLSPLRKFSNINIQKTFLKQYEIKKEHDKHGIFLCPTRQDSQGVSMCEAMSSGLVPITSNNTAIPEFVNHQESGIITNNKPYEISQHLQKLNNNPEYFLKLSRQASSSIQGICEPKEVIKNEIDMIKRHNLPKK